MLQEMPVADTDILQYRGSASRAMILMKEYSKKAVGF